MKKVIALRGVAKVGKSETIRKARELLLAEYPGARESRLDYGGTVDVSAILEVGDAKVGIETQGDPNSRLEKSLDLFVERGCQAIVCATRTRGATFEAVNRLGDRYDIIWFDQAKEPQVAKRASRNHEMATQIVAEVRQVIAYHNAPPAAGPSSRFGTRPDATGRS